MKFCSRSGYILIFVGFSQVPNDFNGTTMVHMISFTLMFELYYTQLFGSRRTHFQSYGGRDIKDAFDTKSEKWNVFSRTVVVRIA